MDSSQFLSIAHFLATDRLGNLNINLVDYTYIMAIECARRERINDGEQKRVQIFFKNFSGKEAEPIYTFSEKMMQQYIK